MSAYAKPQSSIGPFGLKHKVLQGLRLDFLTQRLQAILTKLNIMA